MAIVRYTWGWRKKESIISIKGLMEMTGTPHRQTIVKLILQLEAMHIITVTRVSHKPSTYSFNKNYEDWTVNHRYNKTISQEADSFINIKQYYKPRGLQTISQEADKTISQEVTQIQLCTTSTTKETACENSQQSFSLKKVTGKLPKPKTPGLQDCIDEYYRLFKEERHTKAAMSKADAAGLKRILKQSSKEEVRAALGYFVGSEEYAWTDWTLSYFASRFGGILSKAKDSGYEVPGNGNGDRPVSKLTPLMEWSAKDQERERKILEERARKKAAEQNGDNNG
jgi:hypothetical protein